MKVETKIEHFKQELKLESGRVLKGFDLIYESYGKRALNDDNIIVICTTLTGSHHAAGQFENSEHGWWDGLIGDNKCVDTKKFFVICVSILAQPYGSTCPLSQEPNKNSEYRLNFPVIEISDVVNAQMLLFDRLKIKKVKAIIGGSLGGMQALYFACKYPNFSDYIISIACSYATQPWVMAFNKVAMYAIKNDPEFNNGNYDKEKVLQNGLLGLKIGRIAGHIGFFTAERMRENFARKIPQNELYELFGRYEVDNYLEHKITKFAKAFDPLCYLYLIKMANNFDLERYFGSLENAFKNVKSKMILLSFSCDVLFNSSEMKEIESLLSLLGKECEYHEISSNHGHVAFLVEIDKIAKFISKAINE